MLTADQLQSIMPRLSPARKAEFLPFLQAAMAEFAIEHPARAAAFLAQLAHESGQLQFMEELWGPTDSQKRYAPQAKNIDLREKEPGERNPEALASEAMIACATADRIRVDVDSIRASRAVACQLPVRQAKHRIESVSVNGGAPTSGWPWPCSEPQAWSCASNPGAALSVSTRLRRSSSSAVVTSNTAARN